MNSTNEKHSFHLQKTIGVLGIIFLLAGFWLYVSIILRGPGPSYRDYDPEMAYFLNSLAPFKGAPYFYTDHPGTPIEMIGTMLLGITYVFFTDHANLISDYLENPEYFLNLAHGLITLLSVLCAVYFFLTVLRTLQQPNVYLALSLALLFYGLHPNSFKTLTVWSHVSFNFPLGAGYLILLFTVAQDAQGQISNRLAAGLGLALGVMIAVVINFAPWLVTTLLFIFLSNTLGVKRIPWEKSLITGSILVLSCAAGFLVSILPSIHRMPYFFGFIYNLLGHQSRYGTGPEGIPSISLLWSNLRDMVTAAPLVFLVMLASAFISLFLFLQRDSRIPENHSLWALNFSLLFQCVIITLAVLKHPGEHYLLSLTATLPVLSLVILKLSDFNWRFRQQFGKALIIFSIISIGALAFLSIKNRHADLLEARAVEAEINRVITEQEIRLNKKPGELLILRTNGTYSYCSALLHGDFFTGGVFATEITKWCPSQAYFINRFDWVYYQGAQVPIQDLLWDLLVARTWELAGNPSWKKEKIVEYPHHIYLVINEK
jgi:hypothetical protein